MLPRLIDCIRFSGEIARTSEVLALNLFINSNHILYFALIHSPKLNSSVRSQFHAENMSTAFVPGSQQRYLRACMVCSIVQTQTVSFAPCLSFTRLEQSIVNNAFIALCQGRLPQL